MSASFGLSLYPYTLLMAAEFEVSGGACALQSTLINIGVGAETAIMRPYLQRQPLHRIAGRLVGCLLDHQRGLKKVHWIRWLFVEDLYEQEP